MVASSGVPQLVERPTSPPSMEALMSDLSLFEDSLLKEPDEEVISELEAIYCLDQIIYVYTN